jgi:hypothetical protein
MTAALCRLGFATAALGRFDEADAHLRGALELSRGMQATSPFLHALSGVGVLLAREGQSHDAAEVLLFSLGHEAMPATYQDVAQPTLDELEAKLDPEELASALQATAGLELDDLVSKVLARGRPALREFARRYTAAWCSQDPARVAENYAPDGSLTINDGPPSVGRAQSQMPPEPSRTCR